MPRDLSFVEVADRVWVRRHAWYDVSVTVVGGERGLVVVDTHASARAMREVLADLGRLVPGAEVVAVVNTHQHFDHVLGNRAVRDAHPGVPIHAHEDAVAEMPAALAGVRAQVEASGADDPHREELLESLADPLLPDHTLSSVAVVDLGDRALEVVHPGRGHTAGDVVVRVPDADVVLAGDLVESSDRGSDQGGATPGLGPDSFPLEWPLTLDFVLQLVTPTTVVVPGHGPVVDRAFVQDQRADLGILAETARDLAGRGVRVEDALTSAEWPFGVEHLGDAVRRIYEQLPRAQKRLPLV